MGFIFSTVLKFLIIAVLLIAAFILFLASVVDTFLVITLMLGCLMSSQLYCWGANADSVQMLVPEVIERYDYNPQCYTQGLELRDGKLFISSGLYGKSFLCESDVRSGQLLRRVDLPRTQFAEGLTLCPAGLWVLTWQEGDATLYDEKTLTPRRHVKYKGEGWGLCYDGKELLMTDGTAKIYRRNPETFDLISSVTVTLGGVPQPMLNELEYVDGVVYANVYLTDRILRINPKTGAVTGLIDASNLLSPTEKAKAEVLNGIAYDRATGHFLLTGKLWPRFFEVKFVEQ